MPAGHKTSLNILGAPALRKDAVEFIRHWLLSQTFFEGFLSSFPVPSAKSSPVVFRVFVRSFD
jgi:hypothetical protein